MADAYPCCAQTIHVAIGRIEELENALKVISIWSGADDPRRETRAKAMGDIHSKAQYVLFHNAEVRHGAKDADLDRKLSRRCLDRLVSRSGRGG